MTAVAEELDLRQFPLDAIHESKTNPRRRFDQAHLADLTASIKEKGVLVPLLVRYTGTHGAVEIVAGARRYRAARAAGLESVPVIIRDLDDKQALEVQVIENLQRADVHPLEEADGYARLMKTHGYQVEDLAAKVGKSESYIYQRLKLAELIPDAKTAFLDDEITAGHAILVARLQPKDQARALKECFDRRWTAGRESRITVSVRELQGWIKRELMLDLATAAFDLSDPNLVPAAGSCRACPKRAGAQPALFSDLAKGDTCTDGGCFQRKIDAFLDRRRAELKAKKVQFREIDGKGASGRSAKSVIGRYEYETIGPAKKCSHQVAGLVVDGEGLGSVKQICITKDCKVHRPHAGSYAPSPSERAAQKRREAERKVKAQTRDEILWAIIDRLPKTPGIRELRAIATGLVGELRHDSQRRFCQLIALEPKKTKRTYGGTSIDYERSIVDNLNACNKLPDMLRLLVELALVSDTEVSTWSSAPPTRLLAAAKAYGVDVAACERKAKAVVKAGSEKVFHGFLIVPCPHCHAKAGSPCKRPSEHGTFGGEPHAERVKAAQALNRKATAK